MGEAQSDAASLGDVTPERAEAQETDGAPSLVAADCGNLETTNSTESELWIS